MIWDEERDTWLIQLLAIKPPLEYSEIATAIAERFDVPMTRSAISGRVFRLGLARPVKPRTAKPKQPYKPRRRMVILPDLTLVPTPEPPPKPEPAPMPEPRPGGWGLLELHPLGCKWPIAYDGQHMFCGSRRDELQPYCAEHTKRAYAPSRR